MQSINIHGVTSARVEVLMFDGFTANLFHIIDEQGSITELCLYTEKGKPISFTDPVVIDHGWMSSENNPDNYADDYQRDQIAEHAGMQILGDR